MISMLRIAAAGALALLLAACTITSDTPLVADREAVTPLPQAFSVFSYDQDEPGSPYVLGDQPKSVPMRLQGKAYVADDASLSAWLVPLDQPDTYLLAASESGRFTYGIAHYAAPLLDVRVLLTQPTRDAIDAAALPGVLTDRDGVKVTDRAGLDAVIAFIADPAVEAFSLAFYLAEDPNAALPPVLIRENGRLKPGS